MEKQCKWPQGSEMMQAYHDKEWCRPSRDNRYIFEMLSLEGAQAGLSWSIVLAKREGYKQAFHDFDIEYCAKLTDEKLIHFKDNYDVIKHLAKLQSVRSNAQAILEIQQEFGGFADFLWQFTESKTIINSWESD